MTAILEKVGRNVRKTKSPIKVMLVDDSVVARSIFERILTQSGDVEIVYQAEDSDAALRGLKEHDVDVILLDIEMPKRTGLEALPELIANAGSARIIIVSSFAEENGPAAVQALALGACDTLPKPGRSGFSGRFSQILVDKVVRIGRPVRRTNDIAAKMEHDLSTFDIGTPSCVAIGASTGGIPAIFQVVSNLDPAITCPVFITQHLPEAFMAFFARQLSGQTKRTVTVAERGVEVLQDNIYIAPGKAHLICRRAHGKVYIDHLDHYAGSRYCPSVDAMFASIAEVYGDSGLAIVLSGMGNDGVQGARLLAEKRAKIIVQDEESSVVWGMPGAIVRESLASTILTPTAIAKLLSKAGSL